VGDKTYETRTPLQVGASDIEGIELHPVAPVDLNGHLRVEGTTTVKPSRVRISLAGGVNNPAPAGAIRDDGSFAFKGVASHVYHVRVVVPQGLYLKSVLFGKIDVMDAPLDLSSGAGEGDLTVTVSANVATLDGAVESDQGEPVAQAEVTIVPVMAPSLAGPESSSATRALMLSRAVITDKDGHFQAEGLAPGRYKVFAWTEVNANAAWFDPEFLKPFDALGRGVELSEGGRQSVRVKVIVNTMAE
jgi:hypothetical protein